MHPISRPGRNRERHESSRGRPDTLHLQQRHSAGRTVGRTDRHSRGTVYLNKPWYRPCELPAVTGIPRSFWRPYKKADDVWIWRKLGTHPSAPVFLHVESVANELDRRGIPYFVNIGGREVDPAMQGYRHRPPALRRPTRKFRRADSKTAVWNPRERARRLIEKMRSQSDSLSPEDRRRLAHELLMLHLECEYLMLRLSNLKAAEALLVEFRQAVEKLLEDSE